jgi:hypothetical protein
MGPVVAPVQELAHAVAEELRRPGGVKLALVPVNTRTWSAEIPRTAAPIVKALAARLKSP